MIRFDFAGLPVSANAERKGWYKAARKRGAYKRDTWVEVQEQLPAGHVLMGGKGDPLRVEIVYVFGPRRRQSDTASNREKVLLDALVSAGVITDDRWIKSLEVASIPGPTDRTLVKVFRITAPTEADVIRWFKGEPTPGVTGGEVSDGGGVGA